MLMDADVGEGGVKNQPKVADVVYGRSQRVIRKSEKLMFACKRQNEFLILSFLIFSLRCF